MMSCRLGLFIKFVRSGFEPHGRHCVVVLEQDTVSSDIHPRSSIVKRVFDCRLSGVIN